MITPSSEQHRRATEVFEQVCDLAPAERAVRVRDLCAHDPELVHAVSRLLEADSSPPGALDSPAVSVRLAAPIDEPEQLPAQIGPFRINGLLGRGGMGVVYLAEQPSPRREVALKVLRAGVASAKMLRRFDNEAEVLAKLHHPGIAQVYEAGVHRSADASAEPRPYFAMEVVRGKPITEHVTEKSLGVRATLTLFAEVCDAVHHAHTKGVIHRDLKPMNVLVDAAGMAKVLDFGVARVTQGMDETTSITLHTQVGQLVGTLQYMSPEQASGDPGDVDTRSDVYSMGLILYELLAGRPALDIPLRPIDEAIRAIREQQPPRLSTLAPPCRGDVETIVAKAIQKDRERRYQSMADLASDIRRHLQDQPIEARPPGAMYELGKFVKRNRRSVVATGLLTLLLVVASGSGLELWLRAERAESAKRESDARKEEIRTFAASISDVFGSLMHELAARAENEANFRQSLPKMSEAFGNVSKLLSEKRILTDAEYRSDFHRGLGEVFYYKLGLPGLGLQQYRLALEFSKKAPVEYRRVEDVKLAFFVGHCYMELDQPKEAEALYRDVVVFVRSHPELVAPMEVAQEVATWGASLVALNQYEEAINALGDAALIARNEQPARIVELVSYLDKLGDCLCRAGRFEEAERTLQEALGYASTLEKESPGATIESRRYIARVEVARKNMAEAERIQREVLAQSVAARGENHHDVATALKELATTLLAKGELAEAEACARRALASVRSVPKPLVRNEARMLDLLASVLEKSPGREEEVKAIRGEAAAAWVRVRGGSK